MQPDEHLMKQDRRLAAAALVASGGARAAPSRRAVETVRLADQHGAEVDYAAVWVAEAHRLLRAGRHQDRPQDLCQRPGRAAGHQQSRRGDGGHRAVHAVRRPRGGDGDRHVGDQGQRADRRQEAVQVRQGPRRQEGRHARASAPSTTRCSATSSSRRASNSSTCRPRSPTSP